MSSIEFRKATPHQKEIMEKILVVCEDWEMRQKCNGETLAQWELECWKFLESFVAKTHGRYS